MQTPFGDTLSKHIALETAFSLIVLIRCNDLVIDWVRLSQTQD